MELSIAGDPIALLREVPPVFAEFSVNGCKAILYAPCAVFKGLQI